jgi:hypothetical protein
VWVVERIEQALAAELADLRPQHQVQRRLQLQIRSQVRRQLRSSITELPE